MTDRSFIVWKDEFSVSSGYLDKQHKGMFEIINNLYSEMQHGLEPEQLHTLLDEARQYAATHFSDEEGIMRDHGFPNFAEHQISHRIYVEKVNSFLLQFKVTEDDLSFDLLKFLKNWWTNHILKMDKEYAPFIGSEDNTDMPSKDRGDGLEG